MKENRTIQAQEIIPTLTTIIIIKIGTTVIGIMMEATVIGIIMKIIG